MTGTDPDILISRVLDGEASPEDWAAFRAHASQDQAIWRHLAEAQQDRAALDEAVESALSVADGVDAPADWHIASGLAARTRTATMAAGWLVAAMVALAAFFGPGFSLGEGSGSGIGNMQAAGFATPEEALRAYFDQGAADGRVLGELPEPRVLQYTPVPDDGGIEVVYVRQIVERAVVDDLYRFGIDETGRPVPMRAELPARPQWRY